jgi:hypothetical protein
MVERGQIIPASQSDDSFGSCASSPLAGECAARFLYFTKIDFAALGGGCSLEPAPHPRPFPRNGGKGEKTQKVIRMAHWYNRRFSLFPTPSFSSLHEFLAGQ